MFIYSHKMLYRLYILFGTVFAISAALVSVEEKQFDNASNTISNSIRKFPNILQFSKVNKWTVMNVPTFALLCTNVIRLQSQSHQVNNSVNINKLNSLKSLRKYT